MTTTKRPTRNVTAADLQLQDIGQVTGNIENLGRRLVEVMAQRDALLEVVKALRDWYAESMTGPSYGALLFEDDRTLLEHIQAAIVMAEPGVHP